MNQFNLKKIILYFSLIIIGIIWRIYFINLPIYQVSYYDEAISGLMAMHMFNGEFPVFYWGCPYLGPLESFSAFIFFKLFEVSTLYLRLSNFLFFLIYGLFSVLIFKKIIKDSSILFILLYLIFPPYYLNHYSVTPIGDYMSIVMLGSILLYLTIIVLEKKYVNMGFYYLIAFLSGFAFWTFIMVIPYLIACYIIILLNDKKLIFNIKFILFSFISFLIGSFPFWIWNYKNNFLTFTMKVSSANSLKTIFVHFFNFLKIFFKIIGGSNEYYWIVFLTFFTVLIFILYLFLKHNKIKTLFEKIYKPNHFFLLILCFLGVSGFYIVSSHGSQLLPRYILGLYSTYPIILCYYLTLLSKKNKIFYPVCIFFILFLNLPSNIEVFQNVSKKSFVSRVTPTQNEIQTLISFLLNKNIKHAYAPYVISQVITFESKEKIICADIAGFRNLEYLKEVDNSQTTALIFEDLLQKPTPKSFEENLNLLTKHYKKKVIGRFSVFYDFKMHQLLFEKVNSNIEFIKVSKNQDIAKNMLDNHLDTKWSTQDNQKIGDEIIIQFKNIQNFKKIVLFPSNNPHHYPKSFKIFISDDNKNWTKIHEINDNLAAFLRFYNKPRLFGKGQTDIIFDENIHAKYIKITLTKKSHNPWSISEILVYRQFDKEKEFNENSLKDIYRSSKVNKIYTYPYIQSKLINNFKDVKTIDLYPKMLTYLHRTRFWNYDNITRFIDFSLPSSFVIYKHHQNDIVNSLIKMNLSYDVIEKDNFYLINVFSEKKLSNQFIYSDFIDWNLVFNPNVKEFYFVKDFTNQIEFDGIKDFNSKYFFIEISNNLKKWKKVNLINYFNKFWTDYAIMQKTPGYNQNILFSSVAHKIRFIKIIPKNQNLDQNKLNLVNKIKLITFNSKIKNHLNYSINQKQNFIFDKKIKLLSYEYKINHKILTISFNFKFLDHMKNNFAIFVHFIDKNNNILFQNDHYLNYKAFNRNQLVLDRQFVKIPKKLTYKGKMYIRFGIWNPETKKNFKTDDNKDFIILDFKT